jgi:hypothetical protein
MAPSSKGAPIEMADDGDGSEYFFHKEGVLDF